MPFTMFGAFQNIELCSAEMKLLKNKFGLICRSYVKFLKVR